MTLILNENNFKLSDILDTPLAVNCPGCKTELDTELNDLFKQAIGLVSSQINDFKSNVLNRSDDATIGMKVQENAGRTYTILLTGENGLTGQKETAFFRPQDQAINLVAQAIINAANKPFTTPCAHVPFVPTPLPEQETQASAQRQVDSLGQNLQLHADLARLLNKNERLEEDLRDAKESFNLKNEEHEELQAQYQSTLESLQGAQAEIGTLKSQVTLLEAEKKTFIDEIGRLQVVTKQNETTIGQLETVLSAKDKELQLIKTQKSQIEEIFRNQEKAIEELKLKIEEQEDLLGRKEKAIKDLFAFSQKTIDLAAAKNKELAALKSEHANDKQELERLKALLTTLTAENKSLSEQLSLVNKEKAAVDAEIAALKTADTKNKAQLEALRLTVTTQDAKLATLQQELHIATAEKQTLATLAAGQKMEIEEKNAEIEYLRNRLATARAALTSAQTEAQALTLTNVTQAALLQQQGQELAKKSGELERLGKELALKEAALKTSETAKEALTKQLSEKEKSNKTTVTDLRSTIARLHEENASLGRSLTDLQATTTQEVALARKSASAAVQEKAELESKFRALELSVLATQNDTSVIDALKATISQLTKELASKKAEYESELAKLKNDTAAKLQLAKSTSHKHIEVLQKRIAQLEKQIEENSIAVKSERSAHAEKEAALYIEINKLSERIQELLSHILTVEVINKGAREVTDELLEEMQLTQLDQVENEAALIFGKKLDAELLETSSESDAELEVLSPSKNEPYSEHIAEILELKDQVNLLKAQVKALQEGNFTRELEDQEMIEGLTTALTTTRQKLQTQTDQVKRYHQNATLQHADILRLEAQVDKLDVENAKLQKSASIKEKLDRQIATLKAQLTYFKEQLESEREEKRISNVKHAQMSAEMGNLRQTLNSLLASNELLQLTLINIEEQKAALEKLLKVEESAPEDYLKIHQAISRLIIERNRLLMLLDEKENGSPNPGFSTPEPLAAIASSGSSGSTMDSIAATTVNDSESEVEENTSLDAELQREIDEENENLS